VQLKQTRYNNHYVCANGHRWDSHDVVISAPHPSDAVLDAAWQVVQEIESGSRPIREEVHRAQWPKLWAALDKLVEAHTPTGRKRYAEDREKVR
jgi:hypothetical protein